MNDNGRCKRCGLLMFILGLCPVVANADYLALSTPPASVHADFGNHSMELTGDGRRYEAEGVVVCLQQLSADETSLSIIGRKPLVGVRLQWPVAFDENAIVLGDHWERTYGETYWRPVGVRRAMPWFFMMHESGRTDGYGVKVQPNAFACWRIENGNRLELVIDLRAAGRPVQLNGRRLEAVTLVSRRGMKDESAFAAESAFCKMMCPNPRLPREPVYGYNDWYCAYGKQNALNYLRDARAVVALCGGLTNRPYAVVDDGWQRRGGNKNDYGWGSWAWTRSTPEFGMDMRDFATAISGIGAKPGLWYRPLIAWPGADTNELQWANAKAFDPTVPSVRARIASDIARFRSWGMKLVKADFLVYDLSGNWVCDRKNDADRLIVDERAWRDDSRTSAEVVKEIYATIRAAAGDDMVIIGCNAVNHLAAGLFEVQRTGDDTSGRNWEPTLRNGVNTLGMRAAMNGTFYQLDADCVGLASADAVPWRLNAQWLDLVARSGTSLFVSWKRDLLDENVSRALREGFTRASRRQPTVEPLDWMSERCPCRWRFEDDERTYDWYEGSSTSDQTCAEKVRTWEERGRPETLAWFEENQFGKTPFGRLPDEVIGVRDVTFTQSGIHIDITCVLPKGASPDHPVPVFLFGDHMGGNTPPDYLPGEYGGIPTNSITARGYAYVRWNFNNVAPNAARYSKDLGRWPRGILAWAATGCRDDVEVTRQGNGWGTIGAWAWGNSRVMDWIETRPELDSRRVAVVGHSRGGKTALWTAAQDARFAMAVSNGSGCGGARLGRANDPKAETIQQILFNFPNWFCPNFIKWANRDAQLPHDADDLLRLIAPRLLYVASGSQDAWAGPVAEKAAWDAAHDIYCAYGCEENMGYHCHEGPHKLTSEDWDCFLDFADKRLKPLRAPGERKKGASSKTQICCLSDDQWTADGEPVSVPHCWNVVDGADGPGAEREAHKDRRTSLELLEGYSRKAVSYRRVLPDPIEDRRQFLKVDAAATVATVKVNGREVGVHKGAFTAFCYEITKFLKPKDNELEIVVDNRRDVDVAPISGDYTMMGGLYRGVWLVETPQVCIDRTIDGGPGVELDVRMDGHVTAKVHVLGGPDETRELYFPNPVLWSPENPKLYEARIELSSGDAVTIPFGFRTTEFREDGFYLNGVKRKLKGVCRHQEVGGKGWATNVEDEKADIALIREMGADAVRTAHYPQSESFYSFLDRAGLVAWCEVPLLNGVTHSEAFVENLKTQYREMVAQFKHHPSICMWSIFNELYENFPMPEESAEPLVEEFAAWAKPIDPTRPQVAASDQVLRTRLNRIPADALAFNRYPGWYNGPIEGTRAIFDEMFASNATRRMFGISEYGGGGSIVQHGDPLVPCKENTIHTEEYQAYLHSRYYAEIAKEPRLWGTFLWVMFDFASDYRTEGDHPGINDKGMVCHDHKTKKDVFYFYQANWTTKPTLHLVGRRMRDYSGDKLNLLAFSNVGTVTLKVNDVLVGAKEPDDVATVLFKDVPLTKRANRIVVTSGGLSDSCEIISVP